MERAPRALLLNALQLNLGVRWPHTNLGDSNLRQHPTVRSWPPTFSDVRWGLGWALTFATIFSAYVLILAAFRGSTTFDKYEMTVWQIIATYFTVAAVGGTLLGLFRPFTAQRRGATVTGAVIGTFVYVGVSISVEGRFSASALLIGAVVGVPMGGYLAHGWWEPP
jgi:hypothetical protein